MTSDITGAPSQAPIPAESGATPRLTLAQLFFSSKGRIGRQAFWLAMLALLVPYALVTVAVNMTDTVPSSTIPGLLFGLAFAYVGVSVLIKRWHDGNFSGLWAITSFIPIANLYALYRCGFTKGTPGANNYGPGTNPTPFG